MEKIRLSGGCKKMRAHTGCTVNCVLQLRGLLLPCRPRLSTYYKVTGAEVFEPCFHLTRNDWSPSVRGQSPWQQANSENGTSQYLVLIHCSHSKATVWENLVCTSVTSHQKEHWNTKSSLWADYGVFFPFLLNHKNLHHLKPVVSTLSPNDEKFLCLNLDDLSSLVWRGGELKQNFKSLAHLRDRDQSFWVFPHLHNCK